MLPYIAEFLGTMLLILLGDGVVANVTLNKSGMKGAGSIQITFAWGLAVMVPAFIFGAASGASFNPALTLALAIDGSFDWALVPGYIIAQFAGAFVEPALYTSCSRSSLTRRMIRARSWACSPQVRRFRIFRSIFYQKPSALSYWCLPLRAREM